MQLVNSMEQVKRNIKVLESYKRSTNRIEQYRTLIMKGICFLVTLDDEGEYIFSPSRFIGYKENTYERHIKNGNKDGGLTNGALSEILGSEPKENPQIEVHFKKFCTRNDIEYNERGAFGKVRKYWMWEDSNIGTANTWIFQGNPNRFKVDDYLRENQDIVWSIRQEHYVKDIRIGDTVYIWRSEAGKQGYGGIIARATVTGLPVSRKDVTSDYWVSPSDANEVLPRVPLRVEELALEDNHLNREYLKMNPILSDLLILKMSNNTNYLLSKLQADELLLHWNSNVSSANGKREIPLPDPVSRNREFISYSEQQRSRVMYEYLFNGNTHRWIDEHTLELDPEWSRGYQAMGILHHLGLKNAYKGLFKGLSVAEAIDLIEQECVEHPNDRTLYEPIISSLSRIDVRGQQDEDSTGDIQTNEGKEYPEGKIAFILHKKRERNPKLIKEAKRLFLIKHGRLYCEACEFDFQEVYGDRGIDFIEGHHKKLVSEMVEGEKTKVEDIAMLCSNCHRMIHRKPLISVEEIAKLIQENRVRQK